MEAPQQRTYLKEKRCLRHDNGNVTAMRDISSKCVQVFQSNRTFYGHTIKHNETKHQ